MTIGVLQQARNSRNNNVRSIRGEREPSPFDGFFLNIGVTTNTETEEGDTEENFVRVNRGVAVSDLVLVKIYDNMSPEFAATCRMQNQIVEQIQNACLQLDEGEGKFSDALSVQLYRRKEEVEASPEEKAELPTLNLFK